MKEHALLLSTEMVLAFLADRKQVTRRIPGPMNSLVDGKRLSRNGWKALELDFTRYEVCEAFEVKMGFAIWSNKLGTFVFVEPIYKKGDWLWFRETWGHEFMGTTLYKASHSHMRPDGGWRPSIHLPKEAARLWAEVTTVSCERVQDITEEQAIKEGVEPNCSGKESCPSPYCKEKGCQTEGEYVHYLRDGDDFPAYSALESFESLWQSIHGEGSWVANPPVYA